MQENERHSPRTKRRKKRKRKGSGKTRAMRREDLPQEVTVLRRRPALVKALQVVASVRPAKRLGIFDRGVEKKRRSRRPSMKLKPPADVLIEQLPGVVKRVKV